MGHNEGEVERPLPGRPVRGSDTGRPMMAALDLFGRRWALRIVWELRFGKSRFSDLRNDIEGISSSTLSQRLSELTAAHIVTQTSDGAYRLSYQGKALLLALGPLELWAKAWAKAVREDAEEDPADQA
ncbi:winged helix-turn-helix transcriptional regulator [Tsukamurella paurometabola]|uniref:HxlR-like helix-turn-helix n=1 Tax=Tsukamurella paurometabola TaxID=2061 RepID=A0A3P8KTH4_TSUPA|nr:helix-turn-helix domain-containing protein [Tsukamurella paurometabola]UEA83023.1 helix-turn-helix transcriptional regulator [Tsukamurella paurometabola]VDR40107.1 HxlR-like helix-turn-helix [Tsukamurella paurometabola]